MLDLMIDPEHGLQLGKGQWNLVMLAPHFADEETAGWEETRHARKRLSWEKNPGDQHPVGVSLRLIYCLPDHPPGLCHWTKTLLSTRYINASSQRERHSAWSGESEAGRLTQLRCWEGVVTSVRGDGKRHPDQITVLDAFLERWLILE